MLTKDYNQRLKYNTFYGITRWSETTFKKLLTSSVHSPLVHCLFGIFLGRGGGGEFGHETLTTHHTSHLYKCPDSRHFKAKG